MALVCVSECLEDTGYMYLSSEQWQQENNYTCTCSTWFGDKSNYTDSHWDKENKNLPAS